MLARILIYSLVLATTSTVCAQITVFDSTFIVEEAWRADANVLQHALTFDREELTYQLTGEWASTDRDHKIGVSIPVVLGTRVDEGLGDVSLDASWQLRGRDRDQISLAPRLSLTLPVQNDVDGTTPALSLALPLSHLHGEGTATHWNVRLGWNDPSLSEEPDEAALGIAIVHALSSQVVSVLESELVFLREAPADGTQSTSRELTVSAGARWAVPSLRALGIIPGVAVPVTFSEGTTTVGLMFHLMLERPLRASSD